MPKIDWSEYGDTCASVRMPPLQYYIADGPPGCARRACVIRVVGDKVEYTRAKNIRAVFGSLGEARAELERVRVAWGEGPNQERWSIYHIPARAICGG